MREELSDIGICRFFLDYFFNAYMLIYDLPSLIGERARG